MWELSSVERVAMIKTASIKTSSGALCFWSSVLSIQAQVQDNHKSGNSYVHTESSRLNEGGFPSVVPVFCTV